MSADDQGKYYNPKFYRKLASAQESAREILPLVLDPVKPASIIDIGCGTGNWLAIAHELGVREILGIDGPWVKAQLAIPPEKFVEHDLSTPLKLNRRFDLALSLEVAEHLPASAARTFVQSLGDARSRDELENRQGHSACIDLFEHEADSFLRRAPF